MQYKYMDKVIVDITPQLLTHQRSFDTAQYVVVILPTQRIKHILEPASFFMLLDGIA